MTGKIKKLVSDKGFGFITSPQLPPEKKDVFFHSSALSGVTFAELKEGQDVTFETEKNEKGLRAINVKLAVAGDETPAESVAPVATV